MVTKINVAVSVGADFMLETSTCLLLLVAQVARKGDTTLGAQGGKSDMIKKSKVRPVTKRRLMLARNTLTKEWRSKFKSPAYISVSRRLYSDDGKYVAYVVGEGASRQLKVSGDLHAFKAGTEAIQTQVIGLPGSSEDIECYRFPERVSWIHAGTERKVVASLSVCRGGDLTKDYEIWIGDLDRFLD